MTEVNPEVKETEEDKGTPQPYPYDEETAQEDGQ